MLLYAIEVFMSNRAQHWFLKSFKSSSNFDFVFKNRVCLIVIQCIYIFLTNIGFGLNWTELGTACLHDLLYLWVERSLNFPLQLCKNYKSKTLLEPPVLQAQQVTCLKMQTQVNPTSHHTVSSHSYQSHPLLYNSNLLYLKSSFSRIWRDRIR